jgi:hypothetical protein
MTEIMRSLLRGVPGEFRGPGLLAVIDPGAHEARPYMDVSALTVGARLDRALASLPGLVRRSARWRLEFSPDAF